MSTTASTSSPSTLKKSQFSVWLPISAFIGTSLALAIPLFMLNRQRIGKNTLQFSLKTSQKTPPPPRRSTTTTTPSTLRTTSKEGLAETTLESSDSSSSSSPGLREMISAISQMNQSTALLAAKAFFIATGLVAIGGITFTWAVKTTLGVEDAREFGQKMRSTLQATVPGLRSRLYRPPDTDDEHYQIQTQHAIEQDWNWEEAEERLKKAYEQGGITLWAQTALTELEAEAEVERTKRDREQAVSSALRETD